MGAEHTIRFRVRYEEADQMGVVHHSRYLTYFEMGRVELLRSVGLPHLEQERRGQGHVIRSLDIRYVAPARYDDVLELVTSAAKARAAQIVFQSKLRRADPGPVVLIAEATMVAAAVTAEGKVRRLTKPELVALNGAGRT